MDDWRIIEVTMHFPEPEEPRSVTVRGIAGWTPTTATELAHAEALLGRPTPVAGLLRALEVEPQPGEPPLEAWLRAQAERNGLPHQLPAHPRLAETIASDGDLLQLIWTLAGSPPWPGPEDA